MTPLLFLLPALAAPADPPAVAIALEVKGAATVERAGKSADLEDGDALREGDKLTVKPGGAVTVYFRPNGPVAVLGGPADATVRPGKLDTPTAVAIREVKVPARAAAGLDRDLKSDLMGGVTLRDFEVPPAVRPAANRAVLTDAPDFAWPAAAGAKAYRVELSEAVKGGYRKVWAADASEPKLAYPVGKRPLPRGKKYVWRVTTDGGELVLPDASFVVLDEAKAAEAAGLAALEGGADPAEWLLAARAYSELGLTDEPIRLLRKVVAARPGSALAGNMLAKHLEAAGLADEAKAVKK
jgi:hypothetical protein